MLLGREQCKMTILSAHKAQQCFMLHSPQPLDGASVILTNYIKL